MSDEEYVWLLSLVWSAACPEQTEGRLAAALNLAVLVARGFNRGKNHTISVGALAPEAAALSPSRKPGAVIPSADPRSFLPSRSAICASRLCLRGDGAGRSRGICSLLPCTTVRHAQLRYD